MQTGGWLFGLNVMTANSPSSVIVAVSFRVSKMVMSSIGFLPDDHHYIRWVGMSSVTSPIIFHESSQ